MHARCLAAVVGLAALPPPSLVRRSRTRSKRNPIGTAPISFAGNRFRQARKFWSFQPVKKFDPPAVNDAGWANTPIDRFGLAKLEEKGIRTVPVADKRTLIRRATFDLIGLAADARTRSKRFLKDESPDGLMPRSIDRLLRFARIMAKRRLGIGFRRRPLRRGSGACLRVAS